MALDHRIRLGLETLIESPPKLLRSARLGLLMNQASVTSRMEYASDRIASAFPGQLRALFSPQHGIFGEQQANMIESGHGKEAKLGIPVYSLYSETRRPTVEMLEQIDCLLIDLQDVGTRVYTFLWTMLECMYACAQHGVAVVVLDRPNPIGGEICEGPMLAPDCKSFVGGFEIPMRHGMTIGELAKLFKTSLNIDVELEVVPLQGWKRSMTFPETGLIWVAPSPNMPRFETTLLYPGQVLLEGINLSEGRGTTLPFEMTGAPFIEPSDILGPLNAFSHPGVLIRPIRFMPTFDKWKDQSCGGVAYHVIDPSAVRSVELTLSFLAACHQLYPGKVKWLPPPYEYEYRKSPIDILFGNANLRNRFENNKPITQTEIESLISFDLDGWRQTTESHRLYR